MRKLLDTVCTLTASSLERKEKQENLLHIGVFILHNRWPWGQVEQAAEHPIHRGTWSQTQVDGPSGVHTQPRSGRPYLGQGQNARTVWCIRIESIWEVGSDIHGYNWSTHINWLGRLVSHSDIEPNELRSLFSLFSPHANVVSVCVEWHSLNLCVSRQRGRATIWTHSFVLPGRESAASLR